MQNVYNEKYLPAVVKVGRIITGVSLIVFFIPFLISWFVYGVTPQWGAIGKGCIAWVAINGPWWISQPISYFPILGAAGTLICNLAGNSSNMGIPCAIAAQKAAEVEPGTDEGSLMSTLGISVSVFVKVAILIVGVFAGQMIIAALPASVTGAMNFLLPALFGCIFAQMIPGNVVSGITALVVAFAGIMLYNMGAFSFIPFDSSIFPMMIAIFGTMYAAWLINKKAAGKNK